MESSLHPYILLLILSSLIAVGHAGATVMQDAPRKSNFLAAALLACAAYWCICQVMWNTSTSAEEALTYIRLSALGWLMIGPIVLHLLLTAAPNIQPSLMRALPWLYAVSGLFVAVDWFTPWIHPAAVRTSWGWTYELGIFSLAYSFTLVLALWSVVMGLRSSSRPISPAERTQVRLIAQALSVPIVVASVTDGILPALRIPFPQLGSISLALLGIASTWSMRRYGYSILLPHAFSREILETLPDGITLLYRNGTVRSSNEVLARMVGCSGSRDLVESSIHEILSLREANLSHELDNVECQLTTRAGTRIPVSVSSRRLKDRQGIEVGLVMSVHDQRELVDLRNRLIISGRLAAVGELAAGVAHEINNPLTYVRANLSLLKQHWDTLGEVAPSRQGEAAAGVTEALSEGNELIEESLEGVDRAAAIVRDIKGLSHNGNSRSESVDLGGLVDTVLRMVAPQLHSNIRVARSYGDIPLLICAPQELTQVLLNLVVNAIQAIGKDDGGGQIRVSTRTEANSVCIGIEDDGCGVEPDCRDRIFDPFFTTKQVGEGTGLGLAISQEIARQHGGEIRFAPREGGGSHFEIRLPLSKAGEL